MAGERENGRGESVASAYRRAAPYLDASSQLAGSVGMGTALGWWLDRRLGTGPWLLVAGALFGIGTGFYLFFKILMNLNREEKK